jgi:murein DD-endopeptidase MepM/ murein hydrolase activator NlpD
VGHHRVEVWIPAAFLLLAVHITVLLVIHARPGLPGVVLWQLAPPLLTLAGIGVLIAALLQTIRQRLTWNRWRTAGYGSLALVAAMPLAYRTYPSSRDAYPSAIRFRLPLDGPVTVAWGGATARVNYHVVLPDQRWAYDLLVSRNGRSFRGEGSTLTDYYVYGQRVLAPAGGLVRRAFDADPDMPPGRPGGGTEPCGNQVVLEVASGEFLFICHLQRHSLQVAEGNMVAAGQVLGRVGNSGNTSQPHVHLHLQTGPQAGRGEGIPMYFHDYRVDGRTMERGMPTGGSRKQVVEPIE